MPLDQSFIGRTYPPTAPYQVGREKIREFATAIGAGDPVHHDVEAAKAAGYPDVVAPPTWPIVITMAALKQIVMDPALGVDYSRVVHGDQRFSTRGRWWPETSSWWSITSKRSFPGAGTTSSPPARRSGPPPTSSS